MKCLLLSLALLELLLWHKGSALLLDKNCAWTDGENILTNTPWMAAVNNENGLKCGGALITKNYVLTAAHCLYNQKAPMFVQLGERHFNVDSVIIHRGYPGWVGPNDIGLLKLDGEVNYTDNIRPICILTDAASVLQKINKVLAFGWGKTMARDLSPVLTTYQLRRLPSEKCQDHMPQLTNAQFCADSEVGGGPGKGDGGGPLAVIIKNRPVQVGITSYGPLDRSLPAVYTDVTSYTRWIASIVRY
ncbi:serine protease 42-like [Drosophila kikkawai]|uniref:Serine protease 42-like n=1 Tax=Drosophila kikkawai TaxID=30033 RepID=A0A6P4J815_DROKI|nr:serine protease 42-like [Drosophila kikkawai]